MTGRDTILIVDDMEINRVILRGVFEADYNLLEAENGQQAHVLLEQYHGRIAAVLLDLVMPVKDGFQVLKEIGQSGMISEFPVIVITAEDSVQNEMQVFDMGASEIIMKPFEPYVVKRRVQNIVELNQHRLKPGRTHRGTGGKAQGVQLCHDRCPLVHNRIPQRRDGTAYPADQDFYKSTAS